jgi:tRNA(fMet)-specific endonuclease VapC
MNGNSVALDTNQAIAILNGQSGIEAWLKQFQTIYLPVIVVGELRYGAANSQNVSGNSERIEKLIPHCRMLIVDLSTTAVYARLRMELKSKARPIPENDLWIAALCVENNLPLATTDKHFDEVSELNVIAR